MFFLSYLFFLIYYIDIIQLLNFIRIYVLHVSVLMWSILNFLLKGDMIFVTDKKDKKPDTKAEKKPPVSLEALPEGAIVIDSTKCKYLVDAFDEVSKGCKKKKPLNQSYII